jgi:hypothetical protein
MDGRCYLECLGVDGKINEFREIVCGGVDWINLAHDRGRWRALVNTVMNLWVP